MHLSEHSVSESVPDELLFLLELRLSEEVEFDVSPEEDDPEPVSDELEEPLEEEDDDSLEDDDDCDVCPDNSVPALDDNPDPDSSWVVWVTSNEPSVPCELF